MSAGGMKLLAAWLLRPHRGVGTEGFFYGDWGTWSQYKRVFYEDWETEH